MNLKIPSFLLSTLIILLSASFGFCQEYMIKGVVKDSVTGEAIAFAYVGLAETQHGGYTDSTGSFGFKKVKQGSYHLIAETWGYHRYSALIEVKENSSFYIFLKSTVVQLKGVTLPSYTENTFGINRLEDVDGTSINAGKKSEVIDLKEMTVNTATNNARQVYSKVPGLNIWESEGAGIQLGIGGRGLNPNRTSNFNTRQNGYDISADPLGYPESYYTPPVEAIDKIEIIRGAGSLQYGPQFGGFINFKLKKAPEDKVFELTSRTTAGSYGFLNFFNSIGGTRKKLSYYSFYQYKRGNGWRENSEFNVNTAFASVSYQFTKKLSVTGEYTHMNYLAHQPGGLTDQMFLQDPRQSLRTRNWFSVKWNLGAILLNYKITSRLKLNSRFFGLIAERDALGLLIAPNRTDPMTERDLWVDRFRNFGNETRMLYLYDMGKEMSAFLIGFRYYNGFTNRKQGLGNAGTEGRRSDFAFVNPDDVEYSNFEFPSNNKALFIENIFQLTSRLSLTPGVRFENIKTEADGFYNRIVRDLAGNIIYKDRIHEYKFNSRSFVIFGLGASYKSKKKVEFYGNVSQNYRSINFNDMRVVNPNLRVDENLQDEKGYTADAGARGNFKNLLSYDVSIFMINYNNRIGTIIQYDTVLYNTYRFRTNVSQSRNIGLEAYGELDVWKLLKGEKAKFKLSFFGNFSFIDARYMNSRESAFDGKQVELVPAVLIKSGITFKKKDLAITYQYSYSSRQYTDATNTEFTSNGINGLIPAFYVMDLSANYTYKRYGFSASVNNVTNNMYFTRRAVGYPGPGIIPADGIGVFLGLQVKVGK